MSSRSSVFVQQAEDKHQDNDEDLSNVLVRISQTPAMAATGTSRLHFSSLLSWSALVLLCLVVPAWSDCGLPAIPFNAHIDQVKNVYFEGDEVKYYCELSELRLLGNSRRRCVASRWRGAVPKCVEELTVGAIKRIEVVDQKNFTVDVQLKSHRPKSAFFGDVNRGSCAASATGRPATWQFHLTKPKRHITYLELVISDKRRRFQRWSQADLDGLIRSVRVNEVRECQPSVSVTGTGNELLVNVTCRMPYFVDSIYDGWDKDQTKSVTVEAGDELIICEVRLYQNSFMPYYRCGSADVVLKSDVEFIKSGSKFGREPYYRFECHPGFELVGPADVRCALNNNWLEEFPTCKPKVTCPMDNQTENMEIFYEEVFSFDGNMSAVVGTVANYRCKAPNNSTVDLKSKVMVGDAIRVCGEDGKWSGVEPICFDKDQLTVEKFQKVVGSYEFRSRKSVPKSFALLDHKPMSCGLPAFPLFARPTSERKFKFFGAQADLRSRYANGTTVYYKCESAYRWITGDVDARTCVDGRWSGKVGKCAVNWGNRFRLASVVVYDQDNNGRWLDELTVEKKDKNQTSEWDEHFAFRQEPDKGRCPVVSLEGNRRLKLALKLNQSTSITFFMVMLHPGGFFGNKKRIYDKKVLANSPITGTVGQRRCQLTSAWDYVNSRFGTFLFFACDVEESTGFRSEYLDRVINLMLEPDQFHKSFTAKNLSICSLSVMSAQDDCGTPDIPDKAIVNYDKNKRLVQYRCKDGFELDGPAIVRCGRHGRWLDDFPRCAKVKNFCPMKDWLRKAIDSSQTNDVIGKLVNRNKSDVVKGAPKDTVIEFQCPNLSNLILLGPSTVSCMGNGLWSGTVASCIDKSSLRSSGSALMIIAIILMSIFGSLLLTVFVLFYFDFINAPNLSLPNVRLPKMPKIKLPRINIPSPSSASSFNRVQDINTRNGLADISNINSNETNNNNNNNSNSINNSKNVTNSSSYPPKSASCTSINEHFPVFSVGTEPLVLRDPEY